MKIKPIYALLGAALLSVLATRAQQPLPLSLAECRERALAHSEELQQADIRLEQARLDRRIASAAALPKIEGSATGAYVMPDIDMMGMELRMRGTYMAGLTLTQPLYAGGKISAARRMARIGEEVAGEQQRMTRMDVLVEADNAYWTLVAVDRKVCMLESYAAQMDTLYDQVSVAFQTGMAIENDRLRIEAKRSEIHYQLQKARNGADLCRMSLCRVIGVDSDQRPVPTDTLFQPSAPGLLSAELDARPELRMLEQQVAIGEQQIRDARSAVLPAAGLSLGYTYYGNIKQYGRCRRRQLRPLYAGVSRRTGNGDGGREDSDFPLGREPQEGSQGALRAAERAARPAEEYAPDDARGRAGNPQRRGRLPDDSDGRTGLAAGRREPARDA